MMEDMPPLSELGEKRREAILGRALEEAFRRRRTRNARRMGLVCLVLGLVTIPLWRPFAKVNVPEVVKQNEPVPAVATLETPLIVSRIETDPDIVQRLALPERASHVEIIRDEQLLQELAAAHEPAGLAYVDGKAILMFR